MTRTIILLSSDEKRACHREWINYFIHQSHNAHRIIKLPLKGIAEITMQVRRAERETWGAELSILSL